MKFEDYLAAGERSARAVATNGFSRKVPLVHRATDGHPRIIMCTATPGILHLDVLRKEEGGTALCHTLDFALPSAETRPGKSAVGAGDDAPGLVDTLTRHLAMVADTCAKENEFYQMMVQRNDRRKGYEHEFGPRTLQHALQAQMLPSRAWSLLPGQSSPAEKSEDWIALNMVLAKAYAMGNALVVTGKEWLAAGQAAPEALALCGRIIAEYEKVTHYATSAIQLANEEHRFLHGKDVIAEYLNKPRTQ